jgi:toxin ParE1/3/4
MAIKVRLLPQAEADYFGIYAYTYENFGEEQAEKYTSGLLDAFDLIAEHTLIGRDIGHIRAGYYRYEHESHTIYYRKDESGVAIVRILGAKQDPLRHL